MRRTWKFKQNREPIVSDDFWYDLTDGGYIRPQEVLTDAKQISQVNEAINLLVEFKCALIEAGLLEES